MLAAVVESSFDAIISKDLSSTILSWNPAAERLFGYTAAEAIGESVLMLIPPERRQEENEIIARIRSGAPVESFDTVRRRKDGQLIDVSETISPIHDRSGAIVGASKIARDLTGVRESERHIRMLLREVNHRVKNQYAVILSMIRETRKHSTDPVQFEAILRERIMALSRSHDLLVGGDWKGAEIHELIRLQMEPFAPPERVHLDGPAIALLPGAVQTFGMAFHELATNSAKYGALRVPEGRVDVTWQVSISQAGERRLDLEWLERPVAPPTAEAGSRRGFGSAVLERIAPQSMSGTASVERREGRLHWRLSVPLDSNVAPGRPVDAG